MLRLRENVRYTRSEMRLPIVTRADGFTRLVVDWLYGSMSDGVSWNVSTPKVCSTTRPTSDEIGLASELRRARRQDVGLRARSGSAARAARRPSALSRRTSLKSSASTSAAGSGGSELSCGLQAVDRAGGADDDPIGLPGHAHARLRLDVEERLDPRRVGEVDRRRA